MELKTFEAFDLRSAIKAVKSEFGQNAVILKTHEKMNEGGRKVYEVTASADRNMRPLGAGKMLTPDIDFGDRLDAIEARIGILSENLPRRSHLSGLEASVEDMRKILLDTLKIKNELSCKDLPDYLLNLFNQLKLMDIDDVYISSLMEDLKKIGSNNDDKIATTTFEDIAKSKAVKWMLKRITIAERWNPTKGHMQIQTFIGSSGCGKTSLLAKLAGRAYKKHKTLIASLVNDKIGGNETLRIYSKILGVDFVEFESAVEFESYISSHQEYQLVLLDTGSCSPKNQEQMKILADLKELNLPIFFNLVLSTTDKKTQLERAVGGFSSLGLDTLCFSKLDESWCYGEIFNIASRWDIPISYFSTGQNIPEDIERASKERIVERVFGI